MRTFLDLLAEDIDLDSEQGCEKDQEEKERDHDRRRGEVAHPYPRGHHILYRPWLASKLCHEPSSLAGHITKWEENDGETKPPLSASDVLFVHEIDCH